MSPRPVVSHTPGPWRVMDDTQVYGVSAGDDHDGFVCDTSDHGHGSECDKGNARLIAQAPAMLAALLECCEAFDMLGSNDPDVIEAASRARALLEKIGGQS